MSSNQKKVLLLTGGNTGLGYATISHLMGGQREYLLILCARSQAKADEAVRKLQEEHDRKCKSIVIGMELDYASDESIAGVVKRVEKEVGRLDVLVNNGGVQLDRSFNAGESQMTERQMWNSTWDINVVGPYLLTKAFIPLLLQSPDPRVIFVTSGMSSLGHIDPEHRGNIPPPAGWPKDPKTANGSPAYRCAKTGLNQLMLRFRRLLGNDGVKCAVLAPGMLATGLGGVGADMLKRLGARDVEDGAEVMRAVIEGERDEDAEKGVVDRDGIQPW